MLTVLVDVPVAVWVTVIVAPLMVRVWVSVHVTVALPRGT
jgi:hypothetical protein